MTRSPPFHWRPRSVPLFTRLSPSRNNDLSYKLGLFGSSTPFVTGRPYTLVFNGSVTSSGAVGIALSAGRRPALKTAFPGLRAITTPLKVTRYVQALPYCGERACRKSGKGRCVLSWRATGRSLVASLSYHVRRTLARDDGTRD